jgi:hypothetical protein
MTEISTSTIYHHADHPEWGRGIILPLSAARQDRLDLAFEMGGRRVIMKSFAAKLQAVDVTPLEAKTLLEKLAVRRNSSTPIKVSRAKGAKKAPAAFVDFDAQRRLFRTLFPEGFQDPKYIRTERQGKKGGRDAALASAASAFVPAAFEGSGETAFSAAAELARSSGLVHPLDGSTTLGSIAPEKRPEFLAGLRSWLFGQGDEQKRFEGFLASIAQAAGAGSKRASWPLVTMFAALKDPAKHVSVKPTAFQRQAALLGLPLDYSPVPNYAGYEQFLAVARETESRLRTAGEQPRDLLDVTAFISLTQSPQPAGKGAVAA